MSKGTVLVVDDEANARVALAELLNDTVATGAGVAILPSLYALDAAKRGPDIVLRRIVSHHARRTIALVTRVRDDRQPEFEALAAALAEVAQGRLAQSA